MDRRQFFGASAAVATVAVAPRAFVRTMSDRKGSDSLPTAKATVRLYDFGKVMIEQEVTLDIEVDKIVSIGKGQSILIDGDCFSFDKCTLQLKDVPERLFLGMDVKQYFEREFELPLKGRRYTITKHSTVTLKAGPEGLMGIT